MLAIFASGVSTGRFAMGSNEPLGAPTPADAIDLEADATTAVTHEGQNTATDRRRKAEGGQSLGKIKRGLYEEECSYMTCLTEDVWGFVEAVK